MTDLMNVDEKIVKVDEKIAQNRADLDEMMEQMRKMKRRDYQEVLSDIRMVGRIYRRGRWMEEDLKPLKERVKQCNDEHNCDICEKFSKEKCHLCSGCDTYSTWICKACQRGRSNCPPCSIRERMQELKYDEMMKMEKLVNGILDNKEQKKWKQHFKKVIEELGYFHFLRKREREAMIGRDASILGWMKIIKQYSPLDSVW